MSEDGYLGPRVVVLTRYKATFGKLNHGDIEVVSRSTNALRGVCLRSADDLCRLFETRNDGIDLRHLPPNRFDIIEVHSIEARCASTLTLWSIHSKDNVSTITPEVGDGFLACSLDDGNHNDDGAHADDHTQHRQDGP